MKTLNNANPKIKLDITITLLGIAAVAFVVFVIYIFYGLTGGVVTVEGIKHSSHIIDYITLFIVILLLIIACFIAKSDS
jgi:hypothetical protein